MYSIADMNYRKLLGFNDSQQPYTKTLFGYFFFDITYRVFTGPYRHSEKIVVEIYRQNVEARS